MLVQDRMTRNVVTAAPGTSVLAARRLLTLHRIRHLPVLLGDEVVGIVSDRDIRINDRQLAASLSALQSDLITGRYRRLASVMTAPVHVIRPKTKLQIAAMFMVSRGVGALPVVEDGKLVGIISLTDCVRALALDERKAPSDSSDPRPGRPQPQRVAVVIEPDAAARLRAHNDLAAAGYAALTCPGPAGGTYCPALRESGSLRCPRVPAETELVFLKSDENTLALAEAYAGWLPNATIRLTSA